MGGIHRVFIRLWNLFLSLPCSCTLPPPQTLVRARGFVLRQQWVGPTPAVPGTRVQKPQPCCVCVSEKETENRTWP